MESCLTQIDFPMKYSTNNSVNIWLWKSWECRRISQNLATHKACFYSCLGYSTTRCSFSQLNQEQVYYSQRSQRPICRHLQHSVCQRKLLARKYFGDYWYIGLVGPYNFNKSINHLLQRDKRWLRGIWIINQPQNQPRALSTVRTPGTLSLNWLP